MNYLKFRQNRSQSLIHANTENTEICDSVDFKENLIKENLVI